LVLFNNQEVVVDGADVNMVSNTKESNAQSGPMNPTTLSEQLSFIEKQNQTIIEMQGILAEQLSTVSLTIGSVQSNLDYLINLIKYKSNVKNTPKQASVLPNVQATTMEFNKPTVVRSTVNPEKNRIGNINFEMDYIEYCTILQKKYSSADHICSEIGIYSVY
jgi:hypothetical protein